MYILFQPLQVSMTSSKQKLMNMNEWPFQSTLICICVIVSFSRLLLWSLQLGVTVMLVVSCHAKEKFNLFNELQQAYSFSNKKGTIGGCVPAEIPPPVPGLPGALCDDS